MCATFVRMRCGGLFDFDKQATGTGGMDERDPGAVRPLARRRIDELHAIRLHRRHARVDVGHADADVMQAVALLRNELRDGRIRADGFNELERRIACLHEAQAMQPHHFGLVDRYDAQHGISAMMRTTGYSLSITGQLQAEGAVTARGVHTSDECMPGERYVTELGKRGILIRQSTT